jgi:GNAT superfamily N-acetyltransferase
VASALLHAAIDYARQHGATVLEAYPVETAQGSRITSANLYHGTLAMFERAGFQVVERRQHNATSPVRPIVRLRL